MTAKVHRHDECQPAALIRDQVGAADSEAMTNGVLATSLLEVKTAVLKRRQQLGLASARDQALNDRRVTAR